MRKSRAGGCSGGCSALLGILFLGCLGAAIFFWPTFIDANGTPASATISEKRETVRIHYGDWYRRFQIIAAYAIPGQPMERHAICDVDQKTYAFSPCGQSGNGALSAFSSRSAFRLRHPSLALHHHGIRQPQPFHHSQTPHYNCQPAGHSLHRGHSSRPTFARRIAAFVVLSRGRILHHSARRAQAF